MTLCASSCKVLHVLEGFGELEPSESLLILFSGIYYPNVYIGVFLDVKHCSYIGGGQLCLLGTMPRGGSLIVYECPDAALHNSTFGQIHFFPLLPQLCLHHSDDSLYHSGNGLICYPVIIPHPVSQCCSL